jgi:hypothetical protein
MYTKQNPSPDTMGCWHLLQMTLALNSTYYLPTCVRSFPREATLLVTAFFLFMPLGLLNKRFLEASWLQFTATGEKWTSSAIRFKYSSLLEISEMEGKRRQTRRKR